MIPGSYFWIADGGEDNLHPRDPENNRGDSE
jgi:hypothetical protein